MKTIFGARTRPMPRGKSVFFPQENAPLPLFTSLQHNEKVSHYMQKNVPERE
jgi:hypothetical protein